jgi:hypothetical protein
LTWNHPKTFQKALHHYRQVPPLDGTKVNVPFLHAFVSQLIACHNGFKVLARKIVGKMAIFLHKHLPRSTVRSENLRLPKAKFSFGKEMTGVRPREGDVTLFAALMISSIQFL